MFNIKTPFQKKTVRNLKSQTLLNSLKRKEYDKVEDDIRKVVNAAYTQKDKNVIVKVIIETCYLTDEEKTIACKLVEKAKAHFVKTSTGYGIGGATINDIELISKAVSSNIGIKASGGVQNIEFVEKLYNAAQSCNPHEFRVGSSKMQDSFLK